LSNRIARTLFAVVAEEIVLLHGFILNSAVEIANWRNILIRKWLQHIFNCAAVEFEANCGI
jgi:hypothetical protein